MTEKRQKSEVQNLTEFGTLASEALDASPPAEDAGQVAQGEPKAYGKDVGADEQIDDEHGYPTEQDQPEG
ncbi:MAG: hypothetical protein WAV45_01430 [Propionibacteriaceae bacterium]|jgi:hypothetical protein|nr:hypothetical protein [Propionibacteriaceae bacterium]HBY22143.1 hypothetical protein [Propionibacteriaceae bacterium]